MRNKIWHATLDVVVPLVVRGALSGLIAALVALGLLTDGNGRIPVQAPPVLQDGVRPFESLSNRSPLQRLSDLRSSD